MCVRGKTKIQNVCHMFVDDMGKRGVGEGFEKKRTLPTYVSRLQSGQATLFPPSSAPPPKKNPYCMCRIPDMGQKMHAVYSTILNHTHGSISRWKLMRLEERFRAERLNQIILHAHATAPSDSFLSVFQFLSMVTASCKYC